DQPVGRGSGSHLRQAEARRFDILLFGDCFNHRRGRLEKLSELADRKILRGYPLATDGDVEGRLGGRLSGCAAFGHGRIFAERAIRVELADRTDEEFTT